MVWFSTHWPDGAAWPEAVPRPKPDDCQCVTPASAGLREKPTEIHTEDDHVEP